MSSTRCQALVTALESAATEFEALLKEVGEARLTEPGVNGEWSVKDIVAHVTAWEERVVAWAEALAQGARPQPAPWPGDWSEEQVNAAIFESNQARPLADVLARWRQVYHSVGAAVQSMSDDELFDRKIEWLGDASFAEAIPGNSYEHLREHAGTIRTWLNA